MPIINQVVKGGGTTPTGTIQITTNGTHDVTNYASADVQVPTTAPALYREFQLDANGALQPNTTTTHIMDFTGMTNVSEYALMKAYYQNTAISGAVDMSDLTTLSGNNACQSMFVGCTGLTSVVNLSALTTVSGGSACQDMFKGCIGITGANLSSLTTLGNGSSACYSMFEGCTALTSANLSSLQKAGNSGCRNMFKGTGLTSIDLPNLIKADSNYAYQSMFEGCTALTNVSIPSLSGVGFTSTCDSMFKGCVNLTVLSFPSIHSFGTRTNQFANLCKDIPNITLHFPSNMQSAVEALDGYSTTAPFGAISGTVLFDLPATYTLTGADSNTYSRNPKYDTATSLAWKVGAYDTTNFTPAYYTNGTTNPSVSDAIYSDAACTTAVTTVSAIV